MEKIIFGGLGIIAFSLFTTYLGWLFAKYILFDGGKVYKSDYLYIWLMLWFFIGIIPALCIFE